MKIIYTFLSFLFASLLFSQRSEGQEGWPKSVTASSGATIKMYQWEPESFNNNVLVARAAISMTEQGKSDPTFGVAWITANAETTNQRVDLTSVQVTNLKLPGRNSDDQAAEIRSALEKSIPRWNLSFTTSQLNEALAANQQEGKLSAQLNNNPPKVIYSTKPSMLVLVDGTPRLQHNNELDVDVVVNTPYTIIKNGDGNFYLHGGSFWYSAPAATGPYNYVDEPPARLQKIEKAIRQRQQSSTQEGARGDNAANSSKAANADNNNTIYNIVVSTEPAELIQAKGEASFAPIQGTNLLYISNSDNDVFMDVNSQQYYVLISGRWYKSKALGGNWQYISSDKLPEDFAKIPEGSPKDNVLASVAGTSAAKDAVMQARIPQTAKVDRSKAQAKIDYDGNPQFENIDGTEMSYAVNTPSSVIRWRGRYYCVDNGVWFESYAAEGPWSVCVDRPYAVNYIPPRYPVYNMKYVYIYDVTPDYVYMGYTPGYLNTYIYGPTIVYGTGYYYHPWYGHYYYPRPYTWGFYMRYNPWVGWGLGFDCGFGWFNSGWYDNYYYGYHGWGGYYGGWWGPAVYRPPYCAAPYRQGWGYYGDYYGRAYGRGYNTNVTVVNNTTINNTTINNTNIYNYRKDVVTVNNPRLIDSRHNRTGYAENEGPERIRGGYNNDNDRSLGNRPGPDANGRSDNGNNGNAFGSIRRNGGSQDSNGNSPFGNRPGREINNRSLNGNGDNSFGRSGRDAGASDNSNGNSPFGSRPGRINNNGYDNRREIGGSENNNGNNTFGNRPVRVANNSDDNSNYGSRPGRPSFDRSAGNADDNRIASPERPMQREVQDWRNGGRNDNYRPRPMISSPDVQQPSSGPARVEGGWGRPQYQGGGESSRPARAFGGGESRPSFGGGESRPSFGGGSMSPMGGGSVSRPGSVYGGGGSSDQGGGSRIGGRRG